MAADHSVALDASVARALAAAGISTADIQFFDLYSCFPAAVELGAAALGLDINDIPAGSPSPVVCPISAVPVRRMSHTTIALTVEQCRDRPGQVGALIGVGGVAGNFATGICSSTPPPRSWRYDPLHDVKSASGYPACRSFSPPKETPRWRP